MIKNNQNQNQNQQHVPMVIGKGKYLKLELIGGGKFGQVYRGQNVKSKSLVAIKAELLSDVTILTHEAKILQYLVDKKPADIGIPSLKWYGVEGMYSYIVMDYYGPSLEAISDTCKDDWDICNAYLFQMISVIQYVHGKMLLHRDIKPANFLTTNAGRIVLIDFGMSKFYWDQESNLHQQPVKSNHLIGTPRYMSPFVHSGWEPCRRDDMISIAYTVLYMFLGGKLPWMNHQSASDIGKLKMEFHNRIALYTKIPVEWKTIYLAWIKISDPTGEPNYFPVTSTSSSVQSSTIKKRDNTYYYDDNDDDYDDDDDDDNYDDGHYGG